MDSLRPLACRILRPGVGTAFLAQPEETAAPPLMVDGVIPGERALIAPRSKHPAGGDPAGAGRAESLEHPGWGDLVEILEPSPARRTPPCPHAARCGGCHWLHMDESTQSALRIERLEMLLREAQQPLPPGGIRHTPSPHALGYRYRARFQVERASEGLRIGFHGLGCREVVDVAECPLLAPPLAQVYRDLRQTLVEREISGLTGLELTALPGSLKTPDGLDLTAPNGSLKAPDGLDLTARNGSLKAPSGLELTTRTGSPKALAVLNPRDRAPADWPACGEQLLASGREILVSVAAQPARGEGQAPVVGARSALGSSPAGTPLAVGARGFLQANLEAADHLADCVARLSGSGPGVRVLELFAGSGLLGWRMAAAGAQVEAIESDPLAVEAGQRLPQPALGTLSLRQGNARQALRDHRQPVDVVVVDPPRAGLGPLAEEIAAMRPPRLVIVSCSMTSLARDLGAFRDSGYTLREIATFDLFPQTRHLEAVTLLEASGSHH